jgi:6-pyruvoyltetrahydropterin/6-carboxytetrahydropterin synthase
VIAEIAGGLAGDSWVLDFGDAKRIVAEVCRELDHRFILQRESSELEMEEGEGVFTVSFRDRRYVMPATDVASLPIDNTTAERLAEWIAGRMREEIEQRGARNVASISVGVEEAPGQAGWFTLTLQD